MVTALSEKRCTITDIIYICIFIGRRYMAEILPKTLSNQSIIGPLHVWCFYQNEEKNDNDYILFHRCTVDNSILYNISHEC